MRLVLKAKRMPIGTISRGRKKIAESRWVNIAAEGSGFSRDMINRLRKEWGKLTTANPNSPIYKKLETLIGTLDVSRLRQLASANIKFVSLLAKIQMSKLKRKMTVGGGTSYARPILQPVFKSRYTRRWKGKDGKWHYEYGKPSGGIMRLPDGSAVFVGTVGTKRPSEKKMDPADAFAVLDEAGFYSMEELMDMPEEKLISEAEKLKGAPKKPRPSELEEVGIGMAELGLTSAMMKKSKQMSVGAISIHGGRKMRKVAPGKWVAVGEWQGRKKSLVKKEDITTSKRTIAKYKSLDLDKFVEERDKNLPKKFEAFVTKYTASEYKKQGAKSYLSFSGRSGYAITRDGDLISVFSAPGAHEGKQMIPDAVANGAKTLDCLGPVLPKIYEKFGFETYRVLQWDDKYAPSNWDYEAHGRPNVYMMRLESSVQKSKSDEPKDQSTPEFITLCRQYVNHLFGDEEQVSKALVNLVVRLMK